jgi:hypothetical protein
LYRKSPKKTSTRKKANIPRDTISQNRKDIRDIKEKRKNTLTRAVMARRLATRVNSTTRNINNKFITSTVKFVNLRHIFHSELDILYAERVSKLRYVRYIFDMTYGKPKCFPQAT